MWHLTPPPKPFPVPLPCFTVWRTVPIRSLSVDNLLVILLIFKSFKIRAGRQPRVLKWGIIGAIVMRAGFIFAGIELLERCVTTTLSPCLCLLGALLLYSRFCVTFPHPGRTRLPRTQRTPLLLMNYGNTDAVRATYTFRGDRGGGG